MIQKISHKGGYVKWSDMEKTVADASAADATAAGTAINTALAAVGTRTSSNAKAGEMYNDSGTVKVKSA